MFEQYPGSLIQDGPVFAAGVLVVKYEGEQAFVLATLRADGKGYGLPVGKVEDGEHSRMTAVRECFEETGFIVVTDGRYYMSTDDTTKFCKVYRAYVAVVGVPTHPEEGETCWVTPDTLITKSSWPNYNRNVFKTFNIPFTK